MTDIDYYADLGSSSMKGFFSIGGRVKGFSKIGPVVNECTKAMFQDAPYKDKGTNYVQWGDRYWVCGSNASTVPHKTIPTEPKINSATVRIASALGMALRECNASRLTLNLKILLPFDEMGDEDLLRERLMDGLFSFGVDGQKAPIEAVKEIEILPEGRGMLAWSKGDPGAILLFGHRDLTCLWVENGEIVRNKSITLGGWGFVNLLRQCNYTFKNELEASKYIFLAGAKLNPEYLSKIVKSDDQLEELTYKLGEARTLVWRSIYDQLQTVGITQCTHIAASGGSALYWRDDIADTGLSVDFCHKQAKVLCQEYDLKRTPTVYQALDCYGLSEIGGDRNAKS